MRIIAEKLYGEWVMSAVTGGGDCIKIKQTNEKHFFLNTTHGPGTRKTFEKYSGKCFIRTVYTTTEGLRVSKVAKLYSKKLVYFAVKSQSRKTTTDDSPLLIIV